MGSPPTSREISRDSDSKSEAAWSLLFSLLHNTGTPLPYLPIWGRLRRVGKQRPPPSLSLDKDGRADEETERAPDLGASNILALDDDEREGQHNTFAHRLGDLRIGGAVAHH